MPGWRTYFRGKAEDTPQEVTIGAWNMAHGAKCMVAVKTEKNRKEATFWSEMDRTG